MRAASRGGGSRGGGAADTGAKSALFDVVQGTSASRAIGGGMKRFEDKQKLAVYDYELADSPARLDPNKVAMRQRQGGTDHTQE